MGSHIKTIAGVKEAQERSVRSKRLCRGDGDVGRVMDAIRRIVQELRVASRQAERDFGLSAAQLFVLQKLAGSQATSLNELAARTLTHQSSVSVVVHRLVQRGLVTRSEWQADARRIVLSLSQSGRALVRRSPQAAQEKLIEAIKGLSVQQRRTLARLLEKISQQRGAEAPAPMFFHGSK